MAECWQDVDSFEQLFVNIYTYYAYLIHIFNIFKDNVILMKNKRERFLDVVPKRVDKIVKLIDVLSNCANPNNYEYEKEEVDKIIKTLKLSITELEGTFQRNINKKRKKFKF